VAGISILVTDNDANDLDLAPGKFLVKVPKAISYNLCEVTPPTNYFMSNPACRTVNVTSGQSVWGSLFTHQEKQVINNP
jgi:hypothetical protein